MSRLTGVALSIIQSDRVPALRAAAEAIGVAYVNALKQFDVPGVGDSPIGADAFMKKLHKDISKKTKLFFKAARSLYTECAMVADRIMDGSPSLSVFERDADRLGAAINEILSIIGQACEPGFEVPETTRIVCGELIRHFRKIARELDMIKMVWQRDEKRLRAPSDVLRRKSRKKAAKRGGRRRHTKKGTKKASRTRQKKNY